MCGKEICAGSVQGAELKLKPIDDCLEAQLNHAYTVTSYLKLQDIDYIAGLALRISESLAGASEGRAVEGWMGKCLDLSKAYKTNGGAPRSSPFGSDLFPRPKLSAEVLCCKLADVWSECGGVQLQSCVEEPVVFAE